MPEPQQVKKQRKSTRRSSVPQDAQKEPIERSEPKKRGRKIKYTTDEDRREARRQQNRNYRERRREELIKLRRQNALLKELEKEKSLEQN